MRIIRRGSLAFLVGLLLISATRGYIAGPADSSQIPRQGRTVQRATPPSEISAPFREVRAQDGSFSVKIPSDWNVTSANLHFFQTWSPRGDKVFTAYLDVPADFQSLQYMVAGLRFSGNPIPPQSVAILQRIVSRPLAPVDIVRVLFPKAGAGSIQNMRILEARDLTGSAGSMGIKGALIHYQYMLLPHQMDGASRATLPRILQTQSQLPMEGGIMVYTLPPVYTGIYNTWSFMAMGAEGPPQLFQRNIPVYLNVFQTFQLNERLLQQNAASSSGATQMIFDFGRRMREGWYANTKNNLESTWRSWQRVGDALGNTVRVMDPQDPMYQQTIPADQIPYGVRLWRCPWQDQPIPSYNPPDISCTEVFQVR